MRPFWIGNVLFVAVLALAGLSCEPRSYDPPDLVPMSTVYEPLIVAPATTQARIRADVESVPSPSLPALVGPDTPCQEWVPEAVQAGWPAERETIETLVSIMYRESRCNYDSFNPTDPNGGSRGLLQINGFWCEPRFPGDIGWLQSQGVLVSCDQLFDPAVNLRAGLAIYAYSSAKNNNGWHPWRA